MSVWDKITSTTSEMNPISFKEKKKNRQKQQKIFKNQLLNFP